MDEGSSLMQPMNSNVHTADIGTRLAGEDIRDLHVVGHNRPVGKHLVSASKNTQGDQT
jgi:hypothetical protein